MKFMITSVILVLSTQVLAGSGGGSPACNGPGEVKVSWPTSAPVWEMCYLTPANSSAERGSSLEIRDVYYNGHLVIERSHVPMLFANYTSGLCYRDWKDANSGFLKADRVEVPRRSALTTCDVSTSETAIVSDCPFIDLDNGGDVGITSDCIQGVQVEKHQDHLLLTTNHSAAWYKYTSRYTFYLDGRIVPRFGFANSDGTLADTTHWHHAYWRTNFDIDGPDNDQVLMDANVMTNEFIGFRDQIQNTTWTIRDTLTNRGYRVEATPEDYLVDTDPSGAGQHEVDVMVTKYKQIGSLPEYSDTPGDNNLGDCVMNENALVNNELLTNEDVVFWYRTAVNDIANMGLVCKYGGPVYYPVGDWGETDYIFGMGFE